MTWRREGTWLRRSEKNSWRGRKAAKDLQPQESYGDDDDYIKLTRMGTSQGIHWRKIKMFKLTITEILRFVPSAHGSWRRKSKFNREDADVIETLVEKISGRFPTKSGRIGSNRWLRPRGRKLLRLYKFYLFVGQLRSFQPMFQFFFH